MTLKDFWKYAAATAVIAAVAGALFFSGRRLDKSRKETTCGKIEVEFRDGDGTGLVSADDVKRIVAREYGNCSGRRLEEIDLSAIEKVLDNRNGILKSDAYTTDDGTLHIQISQREPVLRMISGNGVWYVDETGYIFPGQKSYAKRIPVVDGAIPLDISIDFKGEPKTGREREWLGRVLKLAGYMNGSRTWSNAISQINVNSRGQLVLIPSKGRERFNIGSPEEFGKKFAKIEDYYKFIVPDRGEKAYSDVNVSYDGQIVCRK